MRIGWQSTPAIVALTMAVLAPVGARADMQENKRLALELVERVSHGDPEATFEAMRSLFAPSLLEQRPLDGWRGLAKMLERHAGLQVVGLDIDEEHVAVEADSPTGTSIRFRFDFTPEAPGKIAGMSLRAGGHGGDSQLPPFELPDDADRDTIRSTVASYLERLADDGKFSGAVLVAVDGEPLYRGAFGLASREWQVPNTLDTRFGLGSINKTFTKIAIAQLAEAGELSLDDTIADHLPDYPNPEVAQKVTIGHLVNHTSGIGDIFNDRFFNSSRALYREPSDFFPVFADEPLQFEPGESQAYSNGGYMVLGAIIAAVTGKSYSQYIQEKVFDPVGMYETGFFARDEIHPRLAVGYTTMGPDGPGGELRNNLYMLAIRGSSAGNAYSTVDDMLKFDEAVREHRLTPPAWTHWYFGGAEPRDQDPESVNTGRSTVSIGYAGGAPGVSAVVESDGRLTVIALANEDEPGAEAVTRALRRPLTEALR